MGSTPGFGSTETQQSGTRKEAGSGAAVAGTLRFVINNEPHLPSSHNQKKTIRTHVMRNYHARQKTKNSVSPPRRKLLQKTAPKTLLRSQELIDGRTLVLPRAHRPLLCANTKQIVLDDPLPESNKCLTPDSKSRDSDSNEASSISTSPELSIVSTTPSSHSDASPEPSIPDGQFFDRWAFDNTSPYVLFQNEGAPMLCLSSRTWPFPKPIGAEKPKFSIFMPSRILPVTNFKLPRGCMHKSALVIPHIINSREYYSFKVGTITWINHRLNETSLGTNDATIGSILLLINFELMRGNVAETLHHMDGIEQIVALRGGLGSINDRNVLTRILIIDLLVAFLSTSQPRFSPPSLLPADVLGSTFYKIADSPLTSKRTLKVALLNSSFCEGSIACLQRVQSLTIHVMNGNRSYPSTQEPEINSEHGRLNLLEIIQHTSQIYERALLTPPMPFSSRINRDSVVALCQAVESPLNDYTWDEFPGILTWVLLVGCAASEEESVEYNYFMCLLIKIFLGAGYGWLGELREAVITIVAIKARAEKGTKVVPEPKDVHSTFRYPIC